MSIEGQGHFFTIYFPGFVCFVLYWAKISGERLQDHWSSGLTISVTDSPQWCKEIKKNMLTFVKMVMTLLFQLQPLQLDKQNIFLYILRGLRAAFLISQMKLMWFTHFKGYVGGSKMVATDKWLLVIVQQINTLIINKYWGTKFQNSHGNHVKIFQLFLIGKTFRFINTWQTNLPYFVRKFIQKNWLYRSSFKVVKTFCWPKF